MKTWVTVGRRIPKPFMTHCCESGCPKIHKPQTSKGRKYKHRVLKASRRNRKRGSVLGTEEIGTGNLLQLLALVTSE